MQVTLPQRATGGAASHTAVSGEIPREDRQRLPSTKVSGPRGSALPH